MKPNANGNTDPVVPHPGDVAPHGDIDLIQVLGLGLLAFTVLIALMAIILAIFIDPVA